MKTQWVRSGGSYVATAVLLGGILYSILVLTVTPRSAYASSCDCTEELQDAKEFCSTTYGNPNLSGFACPDGNTVVVRCAANPGQAWQYPCGSF